MLCIGLHRPIDIVIAQHNTMTIKPADRRGGWLREADKQSNKERDSWTATCGPEETGRSSEAAWAISQTLATDARLIGSSQGNSRQRSEEHESIKGRADKQQGRTAKIGYAQPQRSKKTATSRQKHKKGPLQTDSRVLRCRVLRCFHQTRQNHNSKTRRADKNRKNHHYCSFWGFPLVGSTFYTKIRFRYCHLE